MKEQSQIQLVQLQLPFDLLLLIAVSIIILIKKNKTCRVPFCEIRRLTNFTHKELFLRKDIVNFIQEGLQLGLNFI